MSKQCAAEGCVRDVRARGYCPMHYKRLRNHGDASRNYYDRTPSERFWEKVDKSGDCWEWRAHTSPHGYGRFSLDGRPRMAHRVSYEWANGAIPRDLMLDHQCRNKACVNPDHLRLVTCKQNQENRLREREDGGLRGVSFAKTRGKWAASAKHHRRVYTAGYYDTQEEAAEAARQLRLSLYTHNDPDRRAS